MPPKATQAKGAAESSAALASLSLQDNNNTLTSCFIPPLDILNSLFTTLSRPPSTTNPDPLPLQAVRNDFIVLTGLLGKEATALALAFKPPVAEAAAIGTVKKLEPLLVKLKFGLENAPREGALGKEINWLALEFLEAYQRFLQALSDHATKPSSNRTKAKEEREHILRLVAQVWTSVEEVKACSVDELRSAAKGWKNVRDLLDDCLEELGEEEEDEEDEEEGETRDPRRPTILLLLRLTRLLLHRLITLSETVAFPPEFLPPAEAFVAQLSPLADELEDGETDELVEVVLGLADLVEKDAGEKEKKWFDMWRLQIGKVVERLEKE